MERANKSKEGDGECRAWDAAGPFASTDAAEMTREWRFDWEQHLNYSVISRSFWVNIHLVGLVWNVLCRAHRRRPLDGSSSVSTKDESTSTISTISTLIT